MTNFSCIHRDAESASIAQYIMFNRSANLDLDTECLKAPTEDVQGWNNFLQRIIYWLPSRDCIFFVAAVEEPWSCLLGTCSLPWPDQCLQWGSARCLVHHSISSSWQWLLLCCWGVFLVGGYQAHCSRRPRNECLHLIGSHRPWSVEAGSDAVVDIAWHIYLFHTRGGPLFPRARLPRIASSESSQWVLRLHVMGQQAPLSPSQQTHLKLTTSDAGCTSNKTH